MKELVAQCKCKPCDNLPRLQGAVLSELLEKLESGWDIVREHHLNRTFEFDGWRPAVAFVNRVADLAEQEKHHPDLLLSYGKVGTTLYTHKADGLTENDFILAAKIEAAFEKQLSVILQNKSDSSTREEDQNVY